MAETLFSTFAISGEGMSVQRMRLSSVAKNIANANTTKGPDGKPYQREVIQVSSAKQATFGEMLNDNISLSISEEGHVPAAMGNSRQPAKTLEAKIIKDETPPRMVYDPAHPDADEKGYVAMPNINIVTEMVEMIAAQRAFEANAGVVESAKNLAKDSLDI